MAWTDSIPAVGNKISVSIPAIEGNFEYIKEFMYLDFYPDPDLTDQGSAGIGSTETVYDVITRVGVTDNATMTFRHSTKDYVTTFYFKTDETIPSNYNVIVDKGAIIDTDYSICDAGSVFTWSSHSGSIYYLDNTI